MDVPSSSQNTELSITKVPEDDSLPTQDQTVPAEPAKEQQKPKGTKRKASSDIQLYTCEVCQVKLNSASQAYQHFQGKSHIGKVKMLEIAAEVKAPPINNSVPVSNTLPTSSLAPSSIQHYCKLCKKVFNSPMQADQHFSGKAHRHKISEDAIAKASPYSSSFVGNSTSANSIRTNSLDVNNQTTHQTPADVKLGANVKSQLFSCEHCHITLNSQRQFEQHVNGLRHKIIVGKAQPPAPPHPEEPGWQEIRYKKLSIAMNTVGQLTNSAATINPGGTRLGQYYCKDCDISVNSPLQLQQHLSSQKHKARLDGTLPAPRKNSGKGRVTNIKPGSVTGSGRNLPPISTSFVKAEKISSFYSTPQPSHAQPSVNPVQAAVPVNNPATPPSQYSLLQQPYPLHFSTYPTQMF